MAKGTRICRVCGKEYEYCHSIKTWDGVNRWQDIACCPEHGAQYFAEVLGNSGAKANVDYQHLVNDLSVVSGSKGTSKPKKSKTKRSEDDNLLASVDKEEN